MFCNCIICLYTQHKVIMCLKYLYNINNNNIISFYINKNRTKYTVIDYFKIHLLNHQSINNKIVLIYIF